MAKWKAGVVADHLEDAFEFMVISGALSQQEAMKYQKKVGIALGISDLLPRKLHRRAIGNELKKHGVRMGLLDENGKIIKQQPVKTGCGKPGEDVYPQWEGLGDRLLRKLNKA